MNLRCTRGAEREYKDLSTGREYFSVSQVLSVLDQNAFGSVPDAVLLAAQQRGVDLHVIFGLLLLSLKGLCVRPDKPTGKLAGYFDAMEMFIADHRPIPVRVEEPATNERLGVAGTPDCLVRIGKILMLIDLKTGGKRAIHNTQLAGGYHQMNGYREAKQMGTLYVRDDGTYTLEPLKKAEESFHVAWFQAGVSVLNGRRMYGVR